MPLVSINIPAYNCEAYIAQTLDSVLAQTFTDWECIIVDDASTDETANIARQYVERDPRFKLHVIPTAEKRPYPNSRNVALKLSTCQWIAPLDGDDWWEPWKLQRQLDAVNAKPGLLFCACAAWIWQDGKVVSRTIEINPATVGRDMLISCVSVHCALIDRQAMLEAGGYDQSMILAEDWDLWSKIILKHGIGCVTAVAEPAMFYRRHANNNTGNANRNIAYDRIVVARMLFKQGMLWRYPFLSLKLLDSQVVREMDGHIRAGNTLRARLRSIMLVAINPLKKWRWSYARRAWGSTAARGSHAAGRTS